MNRVTMNIGIMRYISNSNYKVISIMNRLLMNIGIISYISNSKYKVISINLITRFQEPRDYEYLNNKIYFKSKI